MEKVRAKTADNSERGDAFDVVKPEGWKPPNIGKVLTEAGWAGPTGTEKIQISALLMYDVYKGDSMSDGLTFHQWIEEYGHTNRTDLIISAAQEQDLI